MSSINYPTEDGGPKNTIYRKIFRIRGPKVKNGWGHFAKIGLKVGFIRLEGKTVKVCKYPSQRTWWIWDEGTGDI